MDRLEFSCIEDLAMTMDNYVSENISEDNYPVATAYANYEIAKWLVETLIRMDNPISDIIELVDYEISLYDKEYVVHLTEEGVTCEKVFKDCIYHDNGGDIVFVHEDCNSKLLNHIESDMIYEFGFADDENDRCDCNECREQVCCKDDDFVIHYSKNSKDELHGFSASKSDDNGYYSCSFYTSEDLDKNDIQKMLKDMGF